MYIGIDVGGTYTDGVLIKEKRVYRKIKIPTQQDNLVSSLVKVLDYLIKDLNVTEIVKVVLSTTLITNLVAENKLEPVAMILLPGNGIPLRHNLFKTAFVQEVSGAIDYRGRETKPLDIIAVKKALNEIMKKGYKKIVVAGKFSQRNNSHELRIAEIIKNDFSYFKFELGHKISGELNYPRRIASALLTLATKDAYAKFVADVQEALAKRLIHSPTYILKADGGTLALDKSVHTPIETVYSGPAASLLGVIALTPNTEGSVVLDIGGTTTDIGFIADKQHPVIASKGANINGYLTQIRAFNVKAIPIGGDSLVEIKDGHVIVNPFRVGQAYCMGGPGITPTDALRFLDLVNIGCKEKAEEGLINLGMELNLKTKDLAELIIEKVLNILEKEIYKMYRQWQLEPAYRIWELNNKTTEVHSIIGAGGASQGIVKLLGKMMNCTAITLPEGEVANAIGAALAVPTPTVTLRVDTEQGFYSYFEEGIQDLLPRGFRDVDVLDLAKHLIQTQYNSKVEKNALKYEIIRQETFNVIRGKHRVGRIIIVKLQTPWEIEFKLYEEDSVC